MPIQKAHYPLLIAVCASLFTTPLMVAGVNAILPELGIAMGADATDLSLVGATYSLALAIFQLACGSLGDIWGHRRIFMIGAGIFAITSLLAGFQSSILPFLILRFCQGTGGAMMSAASLALLASASRPEDRAAYLGASGMAVYSGIACGAPIGGFVTAALGWRALFFLSTAASVGVLLIMLSAGRHEWRPTPGSVFDWPGCVLCGLALTALTIGCARIALDPSIGIFAYGVCVIFFALFFRRERRVKFPMLNIASIVKNRTLLLSCAAAFINYACLVAAVFYFSFYLQVAQGLAVFAAGLALAFQPFMQAIWQPVAIFLCNRWKNEPVCAIGCAFCGAGLMISAFLQPQTPIVAVFVAQGFIGSGMSFFALSNTSIILESAGRQNVGQGSALTGAMRTAGQLVGMAIVTLTLATLMGTEAITPATLPGFMGSMRVDFILFAFLNLIAIYLALARSRKPGNRRMT